jgi:predicted RNA-binding protein with PIN domain
MNFLIDGYNLMHLIGLARPGLPAGGLQRARGRFLDWLAESAEGRSVAVHVVFDAANSTERSAESDHRSVRIRFAGGRTADDEIEDLLASERVPARITVVSNDSRLREFARRRGAAFWSCEEFIDWTLEPRRPARKPRQTEPDKPEPVPTETERAEWLAAFSKPPMKRRRR